MISSEVVAYSINPIGNRLISFVWTYPRWLHGEVMTHRAFSRNAGSSRAIPLKKMMQSVIDNPAPPERWGREKKGMQSGDELSPVRKGICYHLWMSFRWAAVAVSWTLHSLGLHKSLCNRLLEPWAHMTILVTASDDGMSNFFALRAHPAAMPEFQILAFRALDQYLRLTPDRLAWGEWHLPFGDMMQYGLTAPSRVKVSTARACWVSYHNQGKTSFDVTDAFRRHDDCVKMLHMSPTEHPAQALHPGDPRYKRSNFDSERLCGWLQYRKTIRGENQTNVYLKGLMKAKPDWIQL